MAGQTTNINLAKPTYSEDADIAVINSNMDIIDGKMGAVGNTSVQAQINTLNSKIEKAPVVYTSYADVKSGITSKAASMATGSFASFDFRANYSTAEDLPGGYYTCIIRKYDNNSYLADIISNIGIDYILSYAGNTWRITSLSSKINENAVNRQTTVADCNDTSIGAGCFRIISTTVNGPFSGSYGVLFNMFGLDYQTQIATSISTSRIWFRKRSGGTWADWTELALNDKMFVSSIGYPPNATLNNNELFGTYFGSGSAIADLPTTSAGKYYQILCDKKVQFAMGHSADGIDTYFVRHYINDKWYPWVELALKSEVDAQKTIFVQLNNQTIAGSPSSAETTTFDLSSHIPSGYSIWSAEVQIRDGSSFYNLPWIHPNIVQATWIDRITNTSVIIKNKADWSGNRSVTFTLHCKKN